MNQTVKRFGKYTGIGILSLGVLVGILFALGILGVPDGGVEDNQWGEVDDERIEVITTVWIDNPNPFGIGGDADVEYDIALQGVHLAEGNGSDIGISSGYNELEFTTDLFYHQLPAWWASHLNNDEVSELEVDATLHTSAGPFSGSPSHTHTDEIETDIEASLGDGLSEFEGSHGAVDADPRVNGMAIQPTVDIEDISVEFGTVTEEHTEIHTTVQIHNPNAYPIPTPAFAGSVEMNDLTLAAWDADEVELLEAEEDALIHPQETEVRTFVVTMDNQNVPPWFASHVDSERPAELTEDAEEYSDMVISARMVMDINGNQISIPGEGQGQASSCEFDVRTNIFVDQESGVDLRSCGFTALEMSGQQIQQAGGTLDLTQTQWWQDQNGGLLDGEEQDGLLNDNDDGLLTGDEEENGTEDDENEQEDGNDDDGIIDDGDSEDDDDGIL